MIDLNYTWCKYTKENYDALLKLGLNPCKDINTAFEKDMEVRLFIKGNIIDFAYKNCLAQVLDNNFWIVNKEVYLVNGNFEYVKNKKKVKEFNLDLLKNKKVAVRFKKEKELKQLFKYLCSKDFNLKNNPDKIFYNINEDYSGIIKETCLFIEDNLLFSLEKTSLMRQEGYKIIPLNDLIK